ncbi:MAG: YbbR-like domain-containing protein [Tannerellaceae bacterium]|nr:YbbR-like domain-containing protein [Tannerellaceae bacterium]MCD8263029.1 YbbR-like domain-containing protein [Tannerellaceae bacterium]
MSRLENINNSFKSVPEEINTFLRRQRWKEVLIFIFFVLLSLGFWMLQSLQQEYEIDITIPVRYKHAPLDISFNEIPPDKVVAHIRDKGSVLLNYTFGRGFIPIEINMKEVAVNGSFSVKRREIESNIQKQLIASTSLLSFEPSQIDISYSTRQRKEVPVTFTGRIDIERGYQQAGNITFEPATVSVYAGASTLDTLTAIKTNFIEIKKGNKTITRAVQLQKLPGTSLEPEYVTVTVPIEEFTEKIIEIPVVCNNLSWGYTLRTFPPLVKVVCNVPLSRFKELSAEDFSIEISFYDLEQNISGTIPVKLTKKPEWIQNITLVPDRIEFLLEQDR